MSFLRLIIYGNLLVSFSAGILTYGVSRYRGFEDAFIYGLSVFFATLFIYNLQRLMRFDDVKLNRSIRHEWLVSNKSLVVFLCIAGAVGASVAYLILGVESDLLLVFGLSILGFLYAYKGLNSRSLREIPFIKIYLISIVWASVSVIWPAYRQNELNTNTLYLLIAIGLYIFAATIPFDMRDLVYDKSDQKTIPQLIGVPLSKGVSILSLAVSAIILIAIHNEFAFSIFFYLAYFGVGLLVLLSNVHRKEMFFSGLIDGWIIVFAITLMY
jgi:hypothetical protein